MASGVNFRKVGGRSGDAGLLTRAVWSVPPAHGWEWLQGPEDLAFPACPSCTLLKGVKPEVSAQSLCTRGLQQFPGRQGCSGQAQGSMSPTIDTSHTLKLGALSHRICGGECNRI